VTPAEIAETISSYENLQAAARRVAKSDPERFLGKDAWLLPLIGPFDLTLEVLPGGLQCSGSTWSNRTQSNEFYEFIVPLDLLAAEARGVKAERVQQRPLEAPIDASVVYHDRPHSEGCDGVVQPRMSGVACDCGASWFCM
jgi:hypothetical protein